MELMTGIDLERRIEILRSTRPWSALSAEIVRAVADAVQPSTYPQGHLIVRQGDPSPGLHTLISGRVEVRVHTDAGEMVVAHLSEGDCFGEMSLLTGDPASADVTAVEDSEIFNLDRDAFTNLLAANPQALQEFVRILSSRLRATGAAVVTAKERERQLAVFMQKERAEQYGELISKHPSVRALQAQIAKQAQIRSPLLLHGERGTGKELIARLIHLGSERKDDPFISVGCSQIFETPWGNKLFGSSQRVAAGPASAPCEVCYMDLAEGGSLLLRNIEALPPVLQDRLASYLEEQEEGETNACDVRVMGTAESSLTVMEQSGRISPRLARALSENVLTVPPLRSRKRDIPELAKQFALDYARRLNKPLKGLDDQAITRLVSYDYHVANVLELKEAVERAVILTDDETIESEEIFLGPPPKENPWSFNLLAAHRSCWRRVLLAIPWLGKPLAAVVFAFILYECFFGPPKDNIATLLVWSLWWPALALSFFFAGRMWCAVCPMALAAQAAQRVKSLKRHIPRWIKDNDMLIMAAGFFFIVWIEEVTSMRQSPVATGLLLLAIATGAVTAGVLFPRRSWCRHLCPLGGFAGLCSTSAMVEVRPTFDICTARCAGHDCFKGDQQTEGCPMFNHVMFVGSNQNCAFCLNCVQSCPNGSPQFNLRVPARELWEGQPMHPETGLFAALVLGLTAGLAILTDLETRPGGPVSSLLPTHHLLLSTVVLVLCGGIPFLGTWLAARYLGRASDPARLDRFWKNLMAWIPLALASFTAHQLIFVPGLAGLYADLGYRSAAGTALGPWSISLLAVFRFLLLTAGLATTILVLWNLTRPGEPQEGLSWLRRQSATLTVVGAYWAALLVILNNPTWLGW